MSGGFLHAGHYLALGWSLLLAVMLSTEEHWEHARLDEPCMLYRLMVVSFLGTLAWMLVSRHRKMHETDNASSPAPAPLARHQPRPAPPPLVIREVPQERYLFIATNDETVNLQPQDRGRDRA